jgi:hypothetical protein
MANLFSSTWVLCKTWSDAPPTAGLDEFLAACRVEVIELFQGTHHEAKMRLNELKKLILGNDYQNENSTIKFQIKKSQ